MDISKKLGIEETDFRLVFGSSSVAFNKKKNEINKSTHGYAKLPETILTALCLVQSISIVVLLIWLLIVRDRLRSREAFIQSPHQLLDGFSE